ncbi:MAG: hypothetical protein L3J83_05935 [Proteobacteria bacterium]|nr:hypothetical protein [Pseudomonadota bacterium]
MMNNNFMGQLLVVTLVFFLLLSSVQMFGWGQGIDSVDLGEENMTALPAMPKATKQAKESSYQDKKILMESIYARPMFSTTREPFKEPENISDGSEEDDEPVSELEAQLTGVVITPEQSYAMILDTTTNQRATYKVGMPLDGEQGGWTLDSIQSRKVVFISDDNKTEELELTVFSGGLKAGAARKKGKSKAKDKNEKEVANVDGNKESKKDKKKNADDIRKKIAERRAQMRADAAKKQ